MESAVGTVQDVINQPSAKGSFPIAMIHVDGWPKAERFAFFSNSERENIFDAKGKRIEFSYEEQRNGKYLNRILQKGWAYLPASQQKAQPATQPTFAPQADTGRQESIERQSAMNQAVNLISAQLKSGVSFVPAEGGKKAKAASVDPEVIFETVKQTAIRIKEFVQRGDWSNKWIEEEAETEPSDDIPF